MVIVNVEEIKCHLDEKSLFPQTTYLPSDLGM